MAHTDGSDRHAFSSRELEDELALKNILGLKKPGRNTGVRPSPVCETSFVVWNGNGSKERIEVLKSDFTCRGGHGGDFWSSLWDGCYININGPFRIITLRHHKSFRRSSGYGSQSR